MFESNKQYFDTSFDTLQIQGFKILIVSAHMSFGHVQELHLGKEPFAKYWVIVFVQVSSMNEIFRNIGNLMGSWHCGQTHLSILYYEGNVPWQ